MEEYKKICRKCLIKDMGEEAYREMIKKHTDIISDKDRTPGELLQKRLDTCRECEKLNAGTCAACGCYVEIRAALKRSSCPYKKWQQ